MFQSIHYAVLILATSTLFACQQNQQPKASKAPPNSEVVQSVSINNEEVLPALAESKISEHRISSKILGYDLRYWVHLPTGYSTDIDYPTLYVTDGVWYIESGDLPEVTDQLIREDKINSIITIFVDAFDPDNSKINRRNHQFLCNPDYVKFYRSELIPQIDQKYSTNTAQSSRGILGLSFGGLNAMYFGVHAADVFGKVGIQSPAPHPCPEVYEGYSDQAKLPIDIYLSTGTVNDKKRATRKLKVILEEKGYDFAYQEVAEGHNWKNWKPLLDDVLLRFYGK